jgi:hypothetical protein
MTELIGITSKRDAIREVARCDSQKKMATTKRIHCPPELDRYFMILQCVGGNGCDFIKITKNHGNVGEMA